jgi:hypothetical protein
MTGHSTPLGTPPTFAHTKDSPVILTSFGILSKFVEELKKENI